MYANNSYLFVLMMFFYVVLFLLKIYIVYRISIKAGFSRPFLLTFIAIFPIFDFAVLLWIASVDFPKIKELASLCLEYKKELTEKTRANILLQETIESNRSVGVTTMSEVDSCKQRAEELAALQALMKQGLINQEIYDASVRKVMGLNV